MYKWNSQIADCRLQIADFSDTARALRRKTHQTIKRVTTDIAERMNFNTAVAAMMELTNELYAFDAAVKDTATDADKFAVKEALEALVKLLAPFTPHIAEELWAALKGEGGHDEVVVSSAWPAYDAELAQADELEIPVQINGKMAAKVIVAAEITDDDLKAAVMADAKVQAKLAGKQIVKTIVVPKRLVNLVVK